MALARTQIYIPDLIAWEISIGEITAEGIALHLVSDAQGRNNWSATTDGDNREPEKKAVEIKIAPTTTEVSAEERRIRFTALDRLSLTNIVVHYRDAVMSKAIEFKIDEFSGSAKESNPVQFVFNGSLQGHEYDFRLDA